MSDLSSELRRLAPLDHSRVLGDVMCAAAAEIERLRARVTELTKQLAARYRAELCDKQELLVEIDQLRAERKRWHALYEYLEEPATLMAIPQPHRMRISELLHGSKP